MSEDLKIDPRKAFAGDDVGKHIRRMASEMMRIGLEHAEEKRIEALRHQYTSAPFLEVTVSQVRLDPPLWRMETCGPLVADAIAWVEERDPAHLEPELRMVAARMLLHYGHVQTWDEAKERVKLMRIQRRGRIVVPKDSERWLGERGR